MEVTSLTFTVASLATILGIFSTIVNLLRNKKKDEESSAKDTAENNARLKILCEQVNDIKAQSKIDNEWRVNVNMQLAEYQNYMKQQADELKEFKEEMKYQRQKLDEVYAEMQFIKKKQTLKKKGDADNE